MSHFKTISSISTHNDKVVLEYLKNKYPIPKDFPRIKNAKTIQYNPNTKLDDIIGAVEDQYKVKDLIRQVPDDIEEISDHPGALSKQNRNFITRFLWKVFAVQPKNETDKAFNRAVKMRTFLVTTTWVIARMVIFRLVRMFVEFNLQKLYVNKLDKHFHNGALTDWLDKQIQSVYDSNPDYVPLTIEEFKKTTIWQRNAAEWRDKSNKQIIRRLSKRSLTVILLILVGKIPSVYSTFFDIPARIALAYLGVRLSMGSINTMVVSHNGNSVILGLSFTRYGFELNNPELFVRRKSDGKIVRVELPDIPKELYLPTKEDIKEFEKENKSIDQIKKELAVIHDRR
jgi:hypothetical protein